MRARYLTTGVAARKKCCRTDNQKKNKKPIETTFLDLIMTDLLSHP